LLNQRLQELGDYAFQRLDRLLAGIVPAAPDGQVFTQTFAMHIGEPQGDVPDIAKTALTSAASQWNRYAPAGGTEDFRAAVTAWLTQRYRLKPDLLDPARHVTPCPGTREALFHTAVLAVPSPTHNDIPRNHRPVVLMPNPFYHTYYGAAILTGAEPVLLDATIENRFMPQLTDAGSETLSRTALAYFCSPANPQGTTASLEELVAALRLARQHNFVLAVDECYAEIYDQDPPPGALMAAAQLAEEKSAPSDPFANLLIFHSLSKRSSVPGLRSGFVAGDSRLIELMRRAISYGGVATSLPVLSAATALWRDEAHVHLMRARTRANWAVAQKYLGTYPGYTAARAGFFLWLRVGDGEAMAQHLWRSAGVRVMPGSYMGRTNTVTHINPGDSYVRIALVHSPEITEQALERISSVLTTPTAISLASSRQRKTG